MQPDAPRGLQKDPDEWTTGHEPMTAAQRSYLQTLSTEAGELYDDTLTKAAAAKRIDELQQRTGRRPEGNGVPQKSAEEQTIDSGQTEADAHDGDLRGVSDR